MRIQLALNVRNLDEAVAFYTKFFSVEPHKQRPGYANFAINTPPLKLVLFENPNATERLHHLGVEVFEPEQIEHTSRRLSETGILDETQRDETCCHATQDKLWAQEPQGLRWEWYRITDDNPVITRKAQGAGCCSSAQENICCQ